MVSVPTRAEVEGIPMPQLPQLEGPGNKAHFQSIAQFLQVILLTAAHRLV